MKSYFDISNKLNEALEPFSPQALGRKRNTMLRALSLDDSGFERWVHDRIIRFSERNGVPLQQLDVNMFDSAFDEWDTQFRQNDSQYDTHKKDVQQYFSRFMAVAPNIIARFQSGQDAPVEEPISPTMLDAETAQGRQTTTQTQQVSYAKPDLPQTQDEMQQGQRTIMSVLDLISNIAVNRTDQQQASTKGRINSEIRVMAQDIANKNNLEAPEQISYDMMKSYVDDLIDGLGSNADQDDLTFEDLQDYKNMLLNGFADNYGLVIPQDDIDQMSKQKAEQELIKKSITPEFVQNIKASNVEIGIIDALNALGENISSIGAKQSKVVSGFSDAEKKYFEVQAKTFLEKYSFLKGSTFIFQGTKRGELDSDWKQVGSTASGSKTSKTDLIAVLPEGAYVRFNQEIGAFERCSTDQIMDNMCENKLKFSIKKGDHIIASAREKETLATVTTAAQNLTKMGADFNDPDKLTSYLIQNGETEENAPQRAQQIIDHINKIKLATKNFIVGKTPFGTVEKFLSLGDTELSTLSPEVQRLHAEMKTTQGFMREVTSSINELTKMLPEFTTEVAYISATGDGKFESGSDSISNYFLSFSNTDPSSGPKIVPITRELMKSALPRTRTYIRFKSTRVNKDKGKSRDESSYRFATVTNIELLDHSSPRQKIQEQKTINHFLKEQNEEDPLDLIQGIPSDVKNFMNDAVDWGFSNLDNMVQFFDMEPEVSNDMTLPDFSDDFGDTYFQKELDDEIEELDML